MKKSGIPWSEVSISQCLRAKGDPILLLADLKNRAFFWTIECKTNIQSCWGASVLKHSFTCGGGPGGEFPGFSFSGVWNQKNVQKISYFNPKKMILFEWKPGRRNHHCLHQISCCWMKFANASCKLGFLFHQNLKIKIFILLNFR